MVRLKYIDKQALVSMLERSLSSDTCIFSSNNEYFSYGAVNQCNTQPMAYTPY